VLPLIGLKIANLSQLASGFRFHSLHEQLAVSQSQESIGSLAVHRLES
jgi:hypothetical protein